MHKFAIPAVAAALLGTMSVALAANATGTIKSIDATKETVTLSDGSTYAAPPSMKLSSFKVGQKVDVTYTQSGGKMEMSAMKPAG